MHIKKVPGILFLMIFLGFALAMSSNAQEARDSVKVLVDWEKNFGTALAKAREQDNTVFIYFWTDWCAPCQQMDEIVFSDPNLGPAINQYINLKVNAEKGEGNALRKKYSIGAYPTFLFVDKKGKKIGEIVGTRSKEKYLLLINNKSSAQE